MFRFNNKDTRRTPLASFLCFYCQLLTNWRRSGVFIVNFEHITHIVLVFILLTFSRLMPAGKIVQNEKTFNVLRNKSIFFPYLMLKISKYRPKCASVQSGYRIL